jgi:Chaperone for flagella basal body P-ring formation
MRWLVAIAMAANALACTPVEGDRILGSDFAAASSMFAALDPSLDLGPAPAAGAHRVYRRPELERLANGHGIEELPTQVCFERATQVLTEEKLLPVLQSALGGGEVEILDFSKNPVPIGNIEFSRAGLTASGLWRGSVAYGDGRSVPVWVKVAVADIGGVQRGDPVRVEVRAGGVLLGFDSVAESSGLKGEPVIVKNPANGRRFRARVEGKGKVSVKR